ncbi:hypothetical protein [Saccharothrix sp. ST-888]|uniref:hypothetical protein n=1 Tax=Saccharothrix sp. ST-888 TaxID=1427391 RepID=UPI0005EC2B1D|nr:hypothetical protein [Saccharothrix sp. ST-888]KJK56166.1 hypothetical protein UK12_24230 [Saccharothrix sp. ST-888]
MEHEVVVPLPATVVQQAMQDPELLVRCVPGLSTDAEEDADAGAAADTPKNARKSGKGGRKNAARKAAARYAFGDEIGGRLRLRIGGSTITYRGVLSLIEGREGVLTAFAEGQESRGSGEASATVRISVTEGGDEDKSTTVRFTGDLSATGRLAELDTATLAAAGRRLLDRFTAALAVEAGGEEPPGATVVYLEAHAPGFGSDLDEDLSDLIPFSDETVFSKAPEEPAADSTAGESTVGEESGAQSTAERPAEADEPQQEQEAEAETDRAAASAGTGESGAAAEADEADVTDEADEAQGAQEAAEAAVEAAAAAAEIPDSPAGLDFEFEQEYEHGLGSPDEPLTGPVRRSIVGRSAEEVDHAPPRGRYAPAPPTRSARARAATRWGGPDAAPVGIGPIGERSAMPWVIGGGVALLGGAVVLVRALRRR